jgi:hypothetical protein
MGERKDFFVDIEREEGLDPDERLPVDDDFFRRHGNTSAAMAIDRKILDEAKWQKRKKIWDSGVTR